jgi:hypothetical protein
VGAADLSDVLRFLAELEARKINYQLTSVRAEALMVEVSVPGERWEIEFMEDGSVEVERFRSDGTIVGREALRELFERFGD